MAFHPYLMFGGNCREALTRYQAIFGGELTLLTMADMPGDDPVPPEQADQIMHGALTIGDDLLMASDDPTGGFQGPRDMQVTYSTPEVDEAQRVFDALAEGGQVTMAAAATFFSPLFGMCVDRFGIPWMVDAEGEVPSG